jgi:hypothetical protein
MRLVSLQQPQGDLNQVRRVPASTLLFPLTAVVYLLQLSPVSGVFLMLVAAPLWSVVLVNAGFAGIAYEALSRRVSIWWLAAPILWFGGYALVAAHDHVTKASLGHALAAANAAVKVPFDADRHALVFVGGEKPDLYIENYDLPIAYQRQPGRKNSRFRSTRLITLAMCQRIRSQPALIKAGVHVRGIHNDSEGGAAPFRELPFCLLEQGEDPKSPAVTVDVQHQETWVRTLPVLLTTTTVTMPGGERFTLRDATASPLAWFPLPVLGCSLDSSAPSWACTTQFYRLGPSPTGLHGPRAGSDHGSLPEALSLRRVSPATRRGSDPPNVEALLGHY